MACSHMFIRVAGLNLMTANLHLVCDGCGQEVQMHIPSLPSFNSPLCGQDYSDLICNEAREAATLALRDRDAKEEK